MERRNLRTSDATDPAKIPGNNTAITGSNDGSFPTAATYNGFAIEIDPLEPVSVFWPNARSMPITATNVTLNHRNGRHRGVGTCPSGNSSGVRKTTGKIPNSQPKLLSRPMATSHQPLWPRVTAYVKTSPPRNDAAVRKDAHKNNNPIVLWPSRLTIKAPTTPNIANATTYGTC